MMFITIFSTVICMFTPVIDVNLSKATHKKLTIQAKYKINILTLTPGEPRHSLTTYNEYNKKFKKIVEVTLKTFKTKKNKNKNKTRIR